MPAPNHFVGQPFRRDLFVKGVRHLSPAALRPEVYEPAVARIVADAVDYVQKALAAQGESLLFEGRALTDPVEARDRLETIVAEFALKRRPMLDRLGVRL